MRLGLLLRFVIGTLRRAGCVVATNFLGCHGDGPSGVVMVTSTAGVEPVAWRGESLTTTSQFSATRSSSSAKTVSLPAPQKMSSLLPSAEPMRSLPFVSTDAVGDSERHLLEIVDPQDGFLLECALVVFANLFDLVVRFLIVRRVQQY